MSVPSLRYGLSTEALSEPDARVPYWVAVRVGERALELTGDENLAGIALVGAILAPVSGFWFILIVAISLMRRGPD